MRFYGVHNRAPKHNQGATGQIPMPCILFLEAVTGKTTSSRDVMHAHIGLQLRNSQADSVTWEHTSQQVKMHQW